MTQQPQVEVSDVVVKSVEESIATTKVLFGLETAADLAKFTKIVIACRSLSGEAHEQVVVPIVEGILEDLKLDPVNSKEDREAAVAFVEVIAMAISDAIHLVYQQMQMAQAEAARRNAAASGQVPLIQG